MIDNRSVEELLTFEPRNQNTEVIGATMPCGAVVTNVYDAYEAGKKAGESLPKAPQDAYDAVQGTSKKLVESISWYVWQNVIRQFKGELEDIRELLKKLDDEKFEEKLDEFLEDWKFTEAVKEAVKELHLSVNVS